MLVMPISIINERVRKFLCSLYHLMADRKNLTVSKIFLTLLTNQSYLGVKKVILFDKSCVVYYYPKFQ